VIFRRRQLSVMSRRCFEFYKSFFENLSLLLCLEAYCEIELNALCAAILLALVCGFYLVHIYGSNQGWKFLLEYEIFPFSRRN
jgi:hypothetical protein